MKKLVFSLIVLLITASVSHAKMVSIAKEKVNMRTGPGTNYPILWELGSGFPLLVKDKKGNWLKVKDFEGDIGWVFRSLTSRTPHLIVKKKRVNIRSGPGEKYEIVGKANYGVVFKTVAKKGGWVKVRHENGLTGWVSRKLLWGW